MKDLSQEKRVFATGGPGVLYGSAEEAPIQLGTMTGIRFLERDE